MAFPAFLTALVPDILKEIAGVAGKFITDKDKLEQFKSEALSSVLNNEAVVTKARAAIVEAEARGESWLQRNWRPITMIWFLVLLTSYWFGFAPDYLVNNPSVVEKVFTLLQIGIGGYIGSRGIEKVVEKVTKAGGIKKMLG